MKFWKVQSVLAPFNQRPIRAVKVRGSSQLRSWKPCKGMEKQPINHTKALEPQQDDYQPWPNHTDNGGLVWGLEQTLESALCGILIVHCWLDYPFRLERPTITMSLKFMNHIYRICLHPFLEFSSPSSHFISSVAGIPCMRQARLKWATSNNASPAYYRQCASSISVSILNNCKPRNQSHISSTILGSIYLNEVPT